MYDTDDLIDTPDYIDDEAAQRDMQNDDLLVRRSRLIEAIRECGFANVPVSSPMMARVLKCHANHVSQTVRRYPAYFVKLHPGDYRIPEGVERRKFLWFILHPHIARA